MSKKLGHFYEFGPFQLDVSEQRLSREREIIPLSPRVFETLTVLVENSGHVLGKDELLEKVWPDSFVEESSLTQNISLIRKALGEGAGEQQFIETVPKRGYRFVAPVRVVPASDKENGLEEVVLRRRSETHVIIEDREDSEAPPLSLPATVNSHARRKLSRRQLGLLCGVLLLATIAAFYFWKMRNRAPEGTAGALAQEVRILAVLPFKPMGSDEQDEFLGLGMADALIIKLSNFEQFTVRPTSSIIKYSGRGHDARAVGQALGVDAVLDGTVQRDGERVRVTVLLLDIRDGKTLWSGKFDERFTDIFSLQDSISERVANVLQLQLAAGRHSGVNKRFTQNVEAYRNYTMGLYFWNKRTKEGLVKALEYFQKATEIDPNYALAYATLADTYCLTVYYRYNVVPPDEAFSRARAAVARALELDDTLSEAHATQGLIKVMADKDFAGADQSYSRAIDLNPNSATARLRYGVYLYSMLRLDDAIANLQRAQELDPLSTTVKVSLTACLIYTRRYDEAIQSGKLAIELDPQNSWARFNLAEAYELKGMYEEAITEYKKIAGQPGFNFPGKAGLAAVYAKTQRHAEARALLAELKPQFRDDDPLTDGRFQIASIHTLLGEKDEAFSWLEKAIAARRVTRPQLRYSCQIDLLKTDSRFKELLLRYEYKEPFLSQIVKQCAE